MVTVPPFGKILERTIWWHTAYEFTSIYKSGLSILDAQVCRYPTCICSVTFTYVEVLLQRLNNYTINHVHLVFDAIGRVLIVWFNDCVLGKLGWLTPYCTIVYAHIYVCESINCVRKKYSQFAINRYSQLKTDLR